MEICPFPNTTIHRHIKTTDSYEMHHRFAHFEKESRLFSCCQCKEWTNWKFCCDIQIITKEKGLQKSKIYTSLSSHDHTICLKVSHLRFFTALQRHFTNLLLFIIYNLYYCVMHIKLVNALETAELFSHTT